MRGYCGCVCLLLLFGFVFVLEGLVGLGGSGACGGMDGRGWEDSGAWWNGRSGVGGCWGRGLLLVGVLLVCLVLGWGRPRRCLPWKRKYHEGEIKTAIKLFHMSYLIPILPPSQPVRRHFGISYSLFPSVLNSTTTASAFSPSPIKPLAQNFLSAAKFAAPQGPASTPCRCKNTTSS